MNYNLWKLLVEYEVVVPVIQRDYAQGRKDNEYIRRMFLNEIKSCLYNNQSVTLDFVYGNIDGTLFYPLDGQQRLTTLWLIYWYISFKSGFLNSDIDVLKKFTYETRSSSGEFCRALCEKVSKLKNDNLADIGIVEYIKSQTWFYSAWLQDPTVSAMLRTLGGDGSNNDDNIEVIFNNSDYRLFRERLIKNPIISFELMVIGEEKLPISDDLYIKMNARGKELTDFENFKADLVAWIQSPKNPDCSNFEEQINSISYKQYYPSRIDNKWTDVFWNSARERMGKEFDGRIDGLFFSFINRFVLNEICLDSSMSPAEYAQGKEDESHRDERKGFDRLFGTGLRGSSADDSLVGYEGFEIYSKYLNFKTLKELDYIFEKIDSSPIVNVIASELNIKDADEDEDDKGHNGNGYSFIPRYSMGQEHALVPTSQKERVYFLAIWRFILNGRETNEFDEIKFSRWMRVVKNLTENAAIDNIPAMVTCMRLINKLSEKMIDFNNDIYKCLKNYSGPFSDNQLGFQLKEEKEKAEKILCDNTWEEKIKKAEAFEFFNGTIRFLYRNVTTVEWDDFDTKFETAKKLFKSSASNRSNNVKISTIEKLLKRFINFEEIEDKYLFTSVGYHARHKCWKKDILCSGDDKVVSKVHFLLLDSAEPYHDNDYQDFLDSGLIEKIVSKSENYKYRYHWYSYWAVHKDYSQTEGVYVSAKRREKNEAFKNLVDAGTVNITDDIFNFYQNGYYWGVRVEFEYDGLKYRWYENFENGNRADKIYRVINDRESANAFVWVNRNDLLSGIDSFAGWD